MAPIPRSAIWLTASGYLPFAIATLIICARLMPGVWDGVWAGAGVWAGSGAGSGAGPWTELVHEWALTAALGYGAVILSFLGGVIWGLAIAADAHLSRWLTLSVIPSLIGWLAVMVGCSPGLWLLTAAFAAMPLLDRAACRTKIAPVWYLSLRLPVSIAVTLTLGLAALGSGLDANAIPSK